MPGKLDEIYISPKSAAPMQELPQVNLIAGKGLEGDRYNYALQTGTYSAGFIDEPGKNCTLVSADAVEKQMAATGMKAFEGGMGALRRNLVVRGLSGDELNDMVGHEVQIGSCRLFVHRRTVPCKYREAQCKRPGLMNRLWDAVWKSKFYGSILHAIDVTPARWRGDAGSSPTHWLISTQGAAQTIADRTSYSTGFKQQILEPDE